MASSQSEEEREKIRESMRQDDSLARILRQLDTGKGDEEELNANPKAVRRSEQIQQDVDQVNGQIVGHRQLLDFDDMIFAEGSHFMSNKRCHLPDGSFRKQRKGNLRASCTCTRYRFYFSNRVV